MPVAAILSYLAKPWVKYVAIGLVAALAFWFCVHQWNGFKEGLRQEGRDQVTAKVQQAIKTNDANNRSLEQALQESLAGFGTKLDVTLTKLDQRQQVSTQTISKIIRDRPQVFNNPVCVTPPDVIAERNKIRAEGPE